MLRIKNTLQGYQLLKTTKFSFYGSCFTFYFFLTLSAKCGIIVLLNFLRGNTMKIINHKPKDGLPPCKPIKCSRCGSTNIAIISEYHKSIYYRVFKIILLAIIIFIFTNDIQNIIKNQGEFSTGILIILAMLYLLAEIIQQYIESKTNIQCVCRDCGNSWLH